MRSFLAFLAISSLANAQWHRFSPRRAETYPPARRTVASNVALDGSTPRPTDAPGRSSVENALELFKREENTWIDDVTCGWFSGYDSSAWVCPPGATCATNTDNVVACTSGSLEPFYTACLDYNAFKQGACGDMGISTGCCQTSSLGACGTFIWSGQPARSMFRCFETQKIINMLDMPQEVLERTTSTAEATSSTQAIESETSPAAGGGGSSDSTGAIVGGVVGGVAVIALSGLGAAFLIARRKRQSYAPIADPMGQPHPPQGRPPSMVQPGVPYAGSEYQPQYTPQYGQQAYGAQDAGRVSLYAPSQFSPGLSRPQSADPTAAGAQRGSSRQSYMSVASVELDSLPAAGHKMNPAEMGTGKF